MVQAQQQASSLNRKQPGSAACANQPTLHVPYHLNVSVSIFQLMEGLKPIFGVRN
jgi:hypothetical protein